MSDSVRGSWSGVRLALVDRDESRVRALAEELGDATAHVADLRELDALPALIARVEEDGPVDGLVNCAGVMRVQQV